MCQPNLLFSDIGDMNVYCGVRSHLVGGKEHDILRLSDSTNALHCRAALQHRRMLLFLHNFVVNHLIVIEMRCMHAMVKSTHLKKSYDIQQ
jgi:hypothetical protein